MGRNNNGPVRMKPKNPPPPRSQPCTCGGTLGIVCKCAGTGTSTDWIDDQDLEDIKNAPKHSK